MPQTDHDIQLAELRRKSIDRLMGAEVFDATAFEALRDYLCAKSELIKSEHFISKQVISCLIEAPIAFDSRVEHVEGVANHMHLADEFRRILWIMARGEACSDHKPGVPRIVCEQSGR